MDNKAKAETLAREYFYNKKQCHDDSTDLDVLATTTMAMQSLRLLTYEFF